MAARLADRLSAARQQRFVGRHAERALFRAALSAPQLPFNVLHVHGPGGIGKSTLLREFLSICEELQVPALHLDARTLDPSPDAFLQALGAALRHSAPDAAGGLDLGGGRRVILVDTYELLRPLDDWLRDVFLPELPESVLVVLAGRNPPAPAWRQDPGWHALVRLLPLRNLSPDESRRYLADRQVPVEAHQAALDFTHGHPLALSLVADLVEQRPEQAFHPQQAPDVIRALLDDFVQEVPSPAHRAAVEACALLRVTTEPLLGEMLELHDPHELFEWLRDLSFIESGPFGLFPHDLAREALSADLRWRDPDLFGELHNRARAYYSRRLSQTRGVEQQRVLSDYVYLHRDNPIIKPFLDWSESGSAVPDAPRPADRPLLRALVAEHEGEESAALAEYWLERQPEGVMVCRGAQQEAIGLLLMVALQRVTGEDCGTDPAIAAAHRYLSARAPLRPGELATHLRFWLARETYQGVSATQSLIFLKIAQYYLTTPNLAFTFFPVADAAFWEPFCSYIDLFPVPEATYTVGGRRYQVFGHDWRVVPPLLWLQILAERELDTSAAPAPTLPASAPVLVLSQPEFAAAVQQALKQLTRPRGIRGNPLLRSRLVLEAAGAEASEGERAAVLQGMIRRAAERLRASPRQAKYYDALHHAYFHPASSQEQAARLLYVSFSTFRRYLKAGTDHLVATLWQWELEGQEKSNTS